MGDVSVIARRINDHLVQYGWSGNGGYYENTGWRLLEWYKTPQLVDYLFSLGELAFIGKPGSENGGFHFMETHRRDNSPHHYGTTEQHVLSRFMFIDHIYFYDSDNTWYYVIPSPFCIKIPLAAVDSLLNNNDADFDLFENLFLEMIFYMFTGYLKEDAEFRELLSSLNADRLQILTHLQSSSRPHLELYHHYHKIYDYFDPWVVVKTDDSFHEITGFHLKKKTNEHIETIHWK